MIKLGTLFVVGLSDLSQKIVLWEEELRNPEFMKILDSSKKTLSDRC